MCAARFPAPVIRPSGFASWYPTKLGSYLFYWETEVHLKEIVPQSLRHFLGYKSGKRLGEDLHTFQRGRERLYNFNFSKLNALRKGRSGAYSKEATCLKFSQAEGNAEAIWVVSNNISYGKLLLVNAR